MGVTLGFRGAIFDVDGVLVASPHERAWRESLRDLLPTEWRATGAAVGYSPEQFTTAVYQGRVAGRPRLSGARVALDYFHIPAADGRAIEYAERKQRRLEELIEAGEFVAFPDALRFALALEARGQAGRGSAGAETGVRVTGRQQIVRAGVAPWYIRRVGS